MNLLRSAFSFASPSGKNGRLSIFIFHRVLPKPDPLFPDEPDATRFNEMMCWIKAWFNVLPLDAAVDALKTGKLPPRAAAITFDDGYADNHDVALPILLRHELPATFFIATGFLDGGRMWNDTVIESIRACQADQLDLTRLGLGAHSVNSAFEKRTAITSIIGQIKYLPIGERLELTQYLPEAAGVSPPEDLMLTSAQVRELHARGMQIGAHTVSHPILARTDLAEARREIAESKHFLENLLETRVSLFAYPNGKCGADYNENHVRIVHSLGFSAALTTTPGAASSDTDPYQLPRFTPWGRSRLKFGVRLLDNFRHLQPQRPDQPPANLAP